MDFNRYVTVILRKIQLNNPDDKPTITHISSCQLSKYHEEKKIIRGLYNVVKPPCAPAQGILTVFKNGGTRRSNNPPSPRLWRVTTPFIPVLPHGAFWRR